MGYRSDVAYTIRFRVEADFALFIAEAKARDDGYGEMALSECTIDQKSLRIDFHAIDVKWYDSYSDVIAHTELVEQARSWCEQADHVWVTKGGDVYTDVQRYKLGCIFVRVGEDSSDVIEDAFGDYDWDWLRVRRSIAIDGDDGR